MYAINFILLLYDYEYFSVYLFYCEEIVIPWKKMEDR